MKTSSMMPSQVRHIKWHVMVGLFLKRSIVRLVFNEVSIYAAFLQPNSTVTKHRRCAHDCSSDEWIFETKKVPLKFEILKEKLIHDRKLFVTSPLWHKAIQSCRMSWKHWNLHTAVLNSWGFVFWGWSNLSPIVSVLATVDFGLRSSLFMTEWPQCGVSFWCLLTAVCWWLQLWMLCSDGLMASVIAEMK